MKAYRSEVIRTPKTPLSFQTSPATAEKVATLARETGRSLSTTVSDIVEEFFAEEVDPNRPAC